MVQVRNLQSSATDIRARLTAVESSQTDLNINVSALEVQVDTLEGVFGDHDGKAAKLKRRLTDIETSISKVEVRITDLEASKVDIDATITSLDARITVLENTKINEMILDGPAENLEMCFAGCSDCRKGYYSLYPAFPIYQCVDSTKYMFGDECDITVVSGQWSTSWCNTDLGQKCHKAWPQGDRAEVNSFNASCKTIDASFMSYTSSSYTFGAECSSSGGSLGGLCAGGCMSGKRCLDSWPNGDRDKERSRSSICQCEM